MVALTARFADLKIKELKHRLSAIPPLVACRVHGNGVTDMFIPFERSDYRLKFGYLLSPLKAGNDSEVLHALLLPPNAGLYAIIENISYEELVQQLASHSELERRAWAESVLLNPHSTQSVSQRVSTDAAQQQLRYREIRRRTKSLPIELRQRIIWDSALECFIPGLPTCHSPDYGHFVLPIKSLENSGELETLLLPPNASSAAAITWPYSSELVASLKARPSAAAVDWIEMMVEEFGLNDEETSAWARPKFSSSKSSWDKQALFRRELIAAQRKEITRRMKSIVTSLEDNGMDGRINLRQYVAIPQNDIDYDPEATTYVFEIQLKGAEFCLVSLPANRAPILTACSYQWLNRHVFKDGRTEVRAWLNKLTGNRSDPQQ